jgi:MEKHLA domain
VTDQYALPDSLREGWMRQTQCLLDSFKRATGCDLFQRSGDAVEEAERLFTAPFVVVAHGQEADPILNYANRAGLQLWEMPAIDFIRTPSRLTAEPTLRAAREKLLAETTREGFVSGYEGVRISTSGRRFVILNVTIWNFVDADGATAGQAATFADWRFLGA